MEDKVIVLSKDGQWFELKTCFLVGAVEYADRVVYYKFMYSQVDRETLHEMLTRAEQFLTEQKSEKGLA